MANPRTIARLEAVIQRRVAYCFQRELNDPRAEFITVVGVELNADLSIAKIFYSVLGDEADRTKTEHLLEHAKGFIRKQLGKVLKTKTIPELRFESDTTLSDAGRLDDIIRTALHKDRSIRGADESEPGEDPNS